MPVTYGIAYYSHLAIVNEKTKDLSKQVIKSVDFLPSYNGE